MFPIYPGFEELPIRVEVKRDGRARNVIARIEEWPASRRAVVICAYEDDWAAGQWLLMNHQREPLHVNHLQALKAEMLAHATNPNVKARRFQGLRSTLREAFEGRESRAVRVCHLPELPAEPRLALCDSARCSWHSRWQMPGQVSFEFEGAAPVQSEPELRAALQREWANAESDARFAWQWAQWREDERRQQLLGEIGDFEEVSRIMRWVLITRGFNEEENFGWGWRLLAFVAAEESASVNFIYGNEMYGSPDSDQATQLWQTWLINHFAPHRRQNWIYQHSCTRDYWEQHGSPLGTALLRTEPTAHEQLETRFSLRDWLADRTTPQQATELLTSLNA